MKKKLLSVLLACVLALSFASPALAEDVSTPAAAVRFFSLVGQGGTLHIETALAVKDDYYNDNIAEYPSLYILEGGVLTLLRAFSAEDCGCSVISHNGNDSLWHPYIDLIFTDAEYLAFDFSADYVLKIPAGIYKDVSGNPIVQQNVSFSGADIVNERNEFTPFGRMFDDFRNYLHSLPRTHLYDLFLTAFDNVTNFIFGILNIKLIQPVTAA